MIRWNIDPIMLDLGRLQLHWYGVLFGTSFLMGQWLTRKMCELEGKSTRAIDQMLGYVVVGTLVGARVGHCLFYEPEVYLRDPLRILKIWEGGLASHGGGIGIFIMLWIFSRKHREFSYLWLLDHLCVGVALAGVFIRTGNLFNSEIIGRPTDVPWAFVFERVDALPRHPAQLYEAISYLFIFIFLWRWYKSPRQPARYPGRIFGLFLILVFGVRFLIEFIKENQVPFEAALPINMGQILSIPMVAAGAWLYFVSARRAVRR
ncbi:MAG TPA: prolipoprotein diacylglyceryl transferase [Bdellovibrionota bacterium]|nr:prolipoprotein diacylglyceryl transferase [Bdellovibrionota bacterium]